MKTNILGWLLFIMSIHSVIAINNDEGELLERIISIEFMKFIENALESISEKGGFAFSYNPSVIDKNQLINANIRIQPSIIFCLKC